MLFFPINKMCLTLSKTSPGFHLSAMQVFWKHCGKRRNCSLREISPFLSVFFLCILITFRHFYPIQSCRLQTLSFWKSLKFVIWKRVNSLPNKKCLDWPKLKAFADNKLNLAGKLTRGPWWPCIAPLADTWNPFIPDITILGNWSKT